MTLALIGLGKMGSRMAGKLALDGHQIHVWNRSSPPIEELKAKVPSVISHKTVEETVASLPTPRVVWMMLPAGDVTEAMISHLAAALSPHDILIDGGNAHFKDTEKRASTLSEKKIRFLGIGVSGGVIAERDGYPQMVGGDKSAYELVTPLLDSLAKPHGGHTYFGPGGAGHFVKMIHNAIEYGYMQALGEGFDVLFNAPYQFDLRQVASLWQKGSLVSGFMLDRVVDALADDPKLSSIIGVVAQSGEAKWTVEQAKQQGTDVEIIERSLDYRRRSESDEAIQKSYTAKLIAALRASFGGHDVKKQ